MEQLELSSMSPTKQPKRKCEHYANDRLNPLDFAILHEKEEIECLNCSKMEANTKKFQKFNNIETSKISTTLRRNCYELMGESLKSKKSTRQVKCCD